VAISPEFAEHLRDLFGTLGPFTVRRMFSGAGLFLGDAMFAIVIDDTLFMKADPDLARAYADAGSEPFRYATRNGRRTIPGLMRLPDSALDDAEEALDWARRSLVPAERAAAEKRAGKARKAARQARR
jgi:DNA transformation protein